MMRAAPSTGTSAAWPGNAVAWSYAKVAPATAASPTQPSRRGRGRTAMRASSAPTPNSHMRVKVSK